MIMLSPEQIAEIRRLGQVTAIQICAAAICGVAVLFALPPFFYVLFRWFSYWPVP
jgi:hypothetical protein